MWFAKMSNSYEMLFFGRFLIGVNCGKCNSQLNRMYIRFFTTLLFVKRKKFFDMKLSFRVHGGTTWKLSIVSSAFH